MPQYPSEAVSRWETGARGISEPIARLVRRLRAEARGRPAVEVGRQSRKGKAG